ncbi:MAG: glycosyltransferase involved in cell wall biosynthesis [Bacteriovoracaceae bacterium]|jgi:glycosyltransferase involved in cell wall biosynthesis
MKSSITVIIPALNEEHNLGPTVRKVREALPKYYNEYEIVIYNDASTDKTGAVAEKLASEDLKISVIHHKESKNIGYIFKDGLSKSQSEFIVMIHGQNDIFEESLDILFSQKEDLVIPYQVNTNERPFSRAIISKLFVFMVNIMFGVGLKYYNHYVLYKRELVLDFNELTTSYAFQAEILIKIFKRSTPSYIEVPFRDDFKNKEKTDAFTFGNILGVFHFFRRMTYEVYFKKK